MLRIAILTLLCSWSLMGEAQRLTLSDKIELNSRRDDFAVIGKYKAYNAVYVYRQDEAYVIMFDSLGIRRLTINIPSINENSSRIHFQCANNFLNIFYEQKEGKTQTLYGLQLLQDSILSEPKALASYETSIFRSRNQFQFAMSEDASKTFFYTYSVGDENYALQAFVLDEHLKEVNSINQLLDKNITRFLFIEEIANDGSAFILISNDLDARGGSDDIQLLSCFPSQKEFSPFTFPLNKKYLYDLQLKWDNYNRIIHFAAYYSDSKSGSTKGLYHYRYNHLAVENGNGHLLPLSIRFSKNKMDLRDLKFKTLSLTKDGGLELVAEKSYQNTRTISSLNPVMVGSMISVPDNNRTVTEFNYDEISIFNIKKEDMLRWNQNILKEQTSSDDGGVYSSYGMLENRYGKVFIFNDMNSRQNKLMSCFVSSKGQMNLKEIQTTEDMDNYDFMPRSGKQIAANEIMMPCLSKSYLCFLNIRF